MAKTVVVAVDRVFAHPIYKKRVRRTKRYKAYDEAGAKMGDEVVIEEAKPVSKGKRWRVVTIEGKVVAGESKPKERKQISAKGKR